MLIACRFQTRARLKRYKVYLGDLKQTQMKSSVLASFTFVQYERTITAQIFYIETLRRESVNIKEIFVLRGYLCHCRKSPLFVLV